MGLRERRTYLSPRPCHTTRGRGEGLLVDVAELIRTSGGARGCCGRRAAEAALRIAEAQNNKMDPLAMIINTIHKQYAQ